MTGRVARVAVDMALAHLDRLFDYEIPESLAEAATVGSRVKVPFAGQMRDGWLIEIADTTEVASLARLNKVVSSEPIVTPEVYGLIRAVADHYAGVWSDVARLAIPPRHATTEKAPQREWPVPNTLAQPEVLPNYPQGSSLLAALAEGRSPRLVWQAAAVHGGPGDLLGGVIEAVDATLRSGRSAVVVLPTVRELTPALARFRAVFGHGAVGSLASEAGRSARYRAYLAASRGEARIIVGTRSAVFAPLHNLGLVVVVDDGHDAHEELRAPYPHARAVAILRASRQNAALMLAGHSRSVDAQALVERGWLAELALTPAEARRVSAPVRAVGEVEREHDPTAARLRIPSMAFRFLREHLPKGPVLVQVPMTGHSASLACQRCGNRAVCTKCGGPMRARRRDVPECALCGFKPTRWSCPHCHTSQLRTPLAGAARTAEELARAFPGVLAVNSSAKNIRDEIPDEPAIVVATPGAEPAAPTGYAGVLILDT
ncbi:MAG: primosomal protein N', partial [Propionibacteriaceae bacterium]|nr:primosomal protein N' [Propionibacteriaceae bacterium]